MRQLTTACGQGGRARAAQPARIPHGAGPALAAAARRCSRPPARTRRTRSARNRASLFLFVVVLWVAVGVHVGSRREEIPTPQPLPPGGVGAWSEWYQNSVRTVSDRCRIDVGSVSCLAK